MQLKWQFEISWSTSTTYNEVAIMQNISPALNCIQLLYIHLLLGTQNVESACHICQTILYSQLGTYTFICQYIYNLWCIFINTYSVVYVAFVMNTWTMKRIYSYLIYTYIFVYIVKPHTCRMLIRKYIVCVSA